MLELQPIGSTYPICEGYYLGQKVKYKDIETEIVGIDLTSFSANEKLLLIKYRKGSNKVTESNLIKRDSNLQIVYCKDVYFIWASTDEIEVIK